MRKKFFVPVATFALILILSFVYKIFVYEPIRAEISGKETETKLLELRERELQKLLERHKNFPEFVEKSGELLAEEEIFLPTEPESEKFAAEIYRVAESNKIEVSSLRAGEVSKIEPKEKNSDDKGELFFQPVKVELVGNYVAILNFIREISDGERFTKLSDVSISTDENENFLKCETEFLIYNRK